MLLRTLRDLLKGLFLVIWNLVKLLVILAVIARIGLAVMDRDSA